MAEDETFRNTVAEVEARVGADEAAVSIIKEVMEILSIGGPAEG